MANTSAVGGFVGGLMQGMEHADTRRRNKAIDNLLDRDAYEKDLDYEGRRIKWQEKHGNLDDFPEFENPAEQDPYLVRGFNWLKDKFQGMRGKDETANVVETPTDEELEPARSALPPGRFYADGGRVDEKRMKRSYGDYYVTEDEAAANRAHRESLPPRYQSPTSPYMREQRGRLEAGRTAIPTFTGSGPGIDKDDFIEAGRDIKNAITGSNTYRSLANLGPVSEANVRNIGDANSPEAAGEAVRHSMVDAGAGALNVAGGVASDVVEGLGLDNLPGFIKGFVGKGGTRANRQPDPNTPPPQAPVSENERAAIDEGVGSEKPAGQVAADAVQKGVEMTPGHPDNPDQAFDWEEVAESGVRPEDIPNMTVKDWQSYRSAAMDADILAGRDVEQTQMNITKMQMQGAQSNLMQAAFLLRSGNTRGAALAARAAFQYFPNGSDVRFGIYESEAGPVLVGMGVDEETGEPIKEGRPMILNPETIAVMAENFSNPEAFRTWTKDWREMAQEDREYHEITVPKEEQAMRTDAARERALDASAYRDRAAAAGAGKGGGLKQSDYDRANTAFKDELEARGISLDNPREADALAADMATLYKQLGGRLQYPEIIEVVMGVNNGEFTLAEGLKKYGIEVGQ